MFLPVEYAAVNQDAGDGGAVAAHVLGHGVQDDIAAVLNRAAEGGRGHSIVDDDRYAVGVRHIRNRPQVRDIAGRVANGLAENSRCFAIDQFRQIVGAVALGEANFDAQFGQHVPEQGPGAAVKLRHGNDVVAGFGQVENRIVDGGLARAERQ